MDEVVLLREVFQKLVAQLKACVVTHGMPTEAWWCSKVALEVNSQNMVHLLNEVIFTDVARHILLVWPGVRHSKPRRCPACPGSGQGAGPAHVQKKWHLDGGGELAD